MSDKQMNKQPKPVERTAKQVMMDVPEPSAEGRPEFTLFRSKHTMSNAPQHLRVRNKRSRRRMATQSRRKNRRS